MAVVNDSLPATNLFANANKRKKSDDRTRSNRRKSVSEHLLKFGSLTMKLQLLFKQSICVFSTALYQFAI